MPRFICPECAGDSVDVEVTAWARVSCNEHDNCETDITDAEDGNQEWDQNSSMKCRECGHTSLVSVFDTISEEGDDEEPECPAETGVKYWVKHGGTIQIEPYKTLEAALSFNQKDARCGKPIEVLKEVAGNEWIWVASILRTPKEAPNATT